MGSALRLRAGLPVLPDRLVWIDASDAEDLDLIGFRDAHSYAAGQPSTPCGLEQAPGTTVTAGDLVRDHHVKWCTRCFPPTAPSTVDSYTLMCGCRPPGHRGGCWLATAETIAMEAYTRPHLDAPPPLGPLIAVLTALCEAGYVHVPDSEGGWLTLLDALVDAEVLGPGGEPT